MPNQCGLIITHNFQCPCYALIGDYVNYVQIHRPVKVLKHVMNADDGARFAQCHLYKIGSIHSSILHI